jgi:hypothetical protein
VKPAVLLLTVIVATACTSGDSDTTVADATPNVPTDATQKDATSIADAAIIIDGHIVDAPHDAAVDAPVDAPIDPATHLAFVVQPSNAGVNAVVAPPIEVAALDVNGNVATSAGGYAEIKLAQPVFLQGTPIALFTNGIATFSSVSVGSAGTYELVAKASQVPGTVTSTAFEITDLASATKSSIVLTPDSVPADGVTPITAVVTALDDAGYAMPGQAVVVTLSGSGADVFPTHGTTNAQGTFSTTLRSTTIGTAVATATIGTPPDTIAVTSTATFTPPPCTLLLPGLPTNMLPNRPSSVATADFDGDGKLDIAVTDDFNLYIYRGMGDGRLYPAHVYPGLDAGLQTPVTTGDLNGDGHPDIVVGGGEVSIFMNTGTGDFTMSSFGIAIDNITPIDVDGVATGDLDDNGTTDLVLDTGSDVLVMSGSGDGTFAPYTLYELPGATDSAAVALELADVDGDGRDDVVAIGLDNLWVLLTNPDGTLEPAIAFPSSYQFGPIGVADYNRDGRLDVAYGGSDAMYIAFGNGDGTFDPEAAFFTEYGGLGLVAVDLDGDGDSDIVAAANSTPSEVRVFHGNGDGTFAASTAYGMIGAVGALAVADFDRDGHLDIAAGEYWTIAGAETNELSVMLGRGDGTLASSPYVGDVPGPTRAYFSPLAGDFDGNGTIDFIAQNLATGGWGAQLAGSDGSLTAAATVAVSGYVQTIGDFDNDGRLDLFVGSDWMRGDGDGTFGAPISSPAPTYEDGIATADFNHDGKLDLAIAGDYLSAGVDIALGGGNGTFGEHVLASNGQNVLLATDLNGDGIVDLVVAGDGLQTLEILLGVGDGSFGSASTAFVDFGADGVAAGDFDGDGVPDLVVSDSDVVAIRFLHGNGDGTFASMVTLDVGTLATGVAAVDMDGDGLLDIVGYGLATIFLRGNGDGTFAAPAFYDAGAPNTGIVRDLDGDGAPDVMQPGPAFGLTRLRNMGCHAL